MEHQLAITLLSDKKRSSYSSLFRLDVCGNDDSLANVMLKGKVGIKP